MTDEVLAVLHCVSCRVEFLACPDCVNTIRIDPATGLPPDVAVIEGRAVHVEADPEATARSVKQPVCDGCVTMRNEQLGSADHITGYTMLWEERHRMGHA